MKRASRCCYERAAGMTQCGSSWRRERVCGRGGIRKNCENLWKNQKLQEVNSPQLKVKTTEESPKED